MSIIAIIVIALLSLFLCASCFFMFKFALILIKVEDALEESLGILDSRQELISNILERPLFFDSPEVKQVQKDIKACRDTVMDIALTLSSNVSSNRAGETYLEEKEED
jgi:hypothetical protein